MSRVATFECNHVQRESAAVVATQTARVQEAEDLQRRHEFERLAQRAHKSIYSLAHRLLSNPTDAEDIAQEALLRAWMHFDAYDRGRPFEAWVLRIVRNLAMDVYRRRKRKPTISLDTTLWGSEDDFRTQSRLPHHIHDPQASVVGQELADHILSAMTHIAPHQREALVLHSLEQLSYEAAAECIGCPTGTVRSRVHRGRIAIREALTQAGYLE